MTYLAPRQGLFAIVVLLSLILHLVFFVVSSEHEASEQHATIAEHIVETLSDELAMAAASEDRVGMNVVAEYYAKQPQVAFIGIYDTKDNLIVPIGSEEAGGYRTKPKAITAGNKALGSVVAQMQPVSRATILASQWLFLVATLVLHAGLWVAYLFLGRPTKELQDQIATDVRAKLLTQGLLPPEPVMMHDEPMAQNFDENQPDGDEAIGDEVAESAEFGDGHFVVQLRFDDPNHLLDAKAYDDKQAYFALCNQLLDKSVVKLLELPLLAGVSVVQIMPFDDLGAKVVLKADNEHAKAATAAMMLSKLVLMVNQIVYDKHRELGRFALLMQMTVSDGVQSAAVYSVSKRRRLPLVLLLDAHAKDEVSVFATLQALERPSSVTERECQVIGNLTQGTTNRLNTTCNRVLLESE